jgi:hypothetical protein
MTITDFDSWLDLAEPEGHEEVYSLHRSITDVADMGLYECSENNGKYFLKASHVDETLMLASDKAVRAFVATIESRFDIDDIETWYGDHHAISKDD